MRRLTMLDINRIRADFASYLQAHAASRHSLDAALMHVVERAYQQGISDAMSVPAVLAEPLADLDPGLAPGMRSPMSAIPHAGGTPRAPGAPAGAGQGGRAAGGDAAAASKISHFYGCNKHRLCSTVPLMVCNHTFKSTDPACTGCARREDPE